MAVDCTRKLADSVAMMGGMERMRISAKLKQPMASPTAATAASPGTIIALLPSITFMATAPASAILAGIDRSTLPGPVVMTNIWPMPTMT